MGCYQDGIAKDSVAGKDVTAHIFEYTSSVIVTDSGEVSQGSCPIQILFCLKEQNKKKLNSHRWFFNAFGPLIKPNGQWRNFSYCLKIEMFFSVYFARCWHQAHWNIYLRALEMLRQAFGRWGCMWRVSRAPA